VLVFALKDSSEHVRWAAANSLLEITDPSLVPLLIPSLLDTAGPYWEQKRICDVIVDILKQIGTEEAKHALLEWQNNSV
jgi:HEAT repeat protein